MTEWEKRELAAHAFVDQLKRSAMEQVPKGSEAPDYSVAAAMLFQAAYEILVEHQGKARAFSTMKHLARYIRRSGGAR